MPVFFPSLAASTLRIGDNANAGLTTVQRTITGVSSNVIFDNQWRNDGVVNLTGGYFDLRGTPVNIGDIRLKNLNFYLNAGITTAQLESISRTNTALILDQQAQLDNSGNVLEVNDATGSPHFRNGMVTGGTIHTSGAAKILLDQGDGRFHRRNAAD